MLFKHTICIAIQIAFKSIMNTTYKEIWKICEETMLKI